jgi:hypothetical protein
LFSFIEAHPFNCSIQILLPIFRAGIPGSEADDAHSAIPSAHVLHLGNGGGWEPIVGPNGNEYAANDDLDKTELVQHISEREYTLLTCKLSVFLETDFVERHIRAECAQFCALSINARLDTTDACAILPDGRLLISATRETYERLGVVGAHAAQTAGESNVSLCNTICPPLS